jgi:hypothetical protein
MTLHARVVPSAHLARPREAREPLFASEIAARSILDRPRPQRLYAAPSIRHARGLLPTTIDARHQQLLHEQQQQQQFTNTDGHHQALSVGQRSGGLQQHSGASFR